MSDNFKGFDEAQRRYDNLSPEDFGIIDVDEDEKLDYEDEDERDVFDHKDYRNFDEDKAIEDYQNAWEKRNKL